MSFGHIPRSSCLPKIILQGRVKGKRRRQKQMSEENIKEWVGIDFAS